MTMKILFVTLCTSTVINPCWSFTDDLKKMLSTRCRCRYCATTIASFKKLKRMIVKKRRGGTCLMRRCLSSEQVNSWKMGRDVWTRRWPTTRHMAATGPSNVSSRLVLSSHATMICTYCWSIIYTSSSGTRRSKERSRQPTEHAWRHVFCVRHLSCGQIRYD